MSQNDESVKYQKGGAHGDPFVFLQDAGWDIHAAGAAARANHKTDAGTRAHTGANGTNKEVALEDLGQRKLFANCQDQGIKNSGEQGTGSDLLTKEDETKKEERSVECG